MELAVGEEKGRQRGLEERRRGRDTEGESQREGKAKRGVEKKRRDRATEETERRGEAEGGGTEKETGRRRN